MKLTLLFIPLAFCSVVFAQEKDQASCFEFSIGTLSPLFSAKYSNIIGADSLSSVSIKPQTGISVGLLKNFDIANKFIVRTGAVASYSKSNFKYNFIKQNEEIKCQIIAADFPLHFIYSFYNDKKNSPDKSYPYILFGGKYSVSAFEESAQKIYFNSNNASVDVGIGGRWYANKKHLFATELKYSFGLINIISSANESVYNRAFSKLRKHCVSFVFNFS